MITYTFAGVAHPIKYYMHLSYWVTNKSCKFAAI